ncbi:trimethylguanosine synthase-like [Salvia divinorum]|uniref:Trimethylguanosine synthase-like n=1 Tax=Salvia divinorum TaxID=28513 RepID=A0ABD1FM17_SALDI
MVAANTSSIVLQRTRKQRKLLKRKAKVREKRKSVKAKKLKEKSNVKGWFSVTPKEIAASQARRFAGAGVVIDAFASVEGNVIQFAKV